jgi:hypothetical protein
MFVIDMTLCHSVSPHLFDVFSHSLSKCVLVQNLQVSVSIHHCSIVYKFLLCPPPLTASAVGESNEDIVPVMHKQAILCALLSSTVLVLKLIIGHHRVGSIGDYGSYNHGVNPVHHL